MLYRYIRCSYVFFFILIICLFTPYASQAALTGEEMEQEASRRKENTVLVQYVNDTTSRRIQTMTRDSAVCSRCAINTEVELLELHENVDIAQYITKLKENPEVRFAEPNRKLHLLAYPNDPLYSEQWALNRVQAAAAWELLPPGQQDILVAVIDSGINSNHPDLCNRIASGGRNYFLDNYDTTDNMGHGTAVAGVIAAETNNAIGIAGVAGPAQVKILPLKTADNNGDSWTSDVIKAINYAIERQVKVINLSMGSTGYSDSENAAIQKAISNGICVVAAAGNYGNSTYSYPASYPGVISVGSIAPDGLRSQFSNYNDMVDLSAPGEGVYSCDYNGSYSTVAGTSFSTPIVAAAAALLIAANPTQVPSQIEGILGKSATDLGIPGKDKYYGYGVVDCLAALQSLEILVSSISLDKETLELMVGESYTLTPTVYPVNASNPQTSWASDNAEVATVDSNGKVKALSEGIATIIAISSDGGKTAVCHLTVKELLTVLIREQLDQNMGEYFTALATGTTVCATIQNGKIETNIEDAFAIEPALQMLLAIDRSYPLQVIKIGGSSYTREDILENLPTREDDIKADILTLVNNPNISSYEEIKLGDLAGKYITLVFAEEEIRLEFCQQDECFIATAAFGSKLQPAVVLLRQFRDKALLTNSPGRAFVSFYYQNSPPVAHYIAGNETAKLVVRILLLPFIAIAYMVINPTTTLVLLLLLLSIILYRRRATLQQ